MHYVWHRSENKHSTSLPPLLLSLTPGDIVYLVYMLARLPGLGETVCCLLLPLAKIVDSEALNVGTVRPHVFSLLYFTPSSCQSTVSLTNKNTNRERKWEKVRWCPLVCIQWGEVEIERGARLFSFPPCRKVEQVVISRLSVDHIIPHVNGKIKPAYTQIPRERQYTVVTVLSASLRSQ